jgi:hypothetical protein
VWLELEDDLQFPASKGSTEQLISIAVLFVSTNLKVRKEAFHSFVKYHSVFSEFISLEVVLKI